MAEKEAGKLEFVQSNPIERIITKISELLISLASIFLILLVLPG